MPNQDNASEKKNPTAEIEANVQECAEELATVNEALHAEIDRRRILAEELASSNQALEAEIAEGRVLKRKLSKSTEALHESQALQATTRHLSLHDALTGLPNLELFHDRLRLGLAQAQRHGWRLAVMFLDIDKFKSINDGYGHDIGDEVLKMVGRRLQDAVRGGDTVCRRSGDEFLFLMLEAKDETTARNLAAKIIDTIAADCAIGGMTLLVRPSVGIAMYPEDGETAHDLLRHADVAMYAAKQEKRGAALYSESPPLPESIAPASTRRPARA